jgi:hypothetical protein
MLVIPAEAKVGGSTVWDYLVYTARLYLKEKQQQKKKRKEKWEPHDTLESDLSRKSSASWSQGNFWNGIGEKNFGGIGKSQKILTGQQHLFPQPTFLPFSPSFLHSFVSPLGGHRGFTARTLKGKMADAFLLLPTNQRVLNMAAVMSISL